MVLSAQSKSVNHLLIPWNPVELGDFLIGDSRILWNSMEYPLEVQGNKVPWNSMELSDT